MKRCLNSPFYNCVGKPQELVKLHYDLIRQPDGTTKRIWHRNVICSVEPHYCGHSKACQLSLTTELTPTQCLSAESENPALGHLKPW